ncbi:MAG TPA: competence/damage-inducible protein A [Actinomycetota bacterium]|nr:competence/damage-inducible protein A [Actinomycetota bacterium]
MRAEVLSVGTELLLGDIVNTNAAHIGQALASIGVDCFMHTTVGDNEKRIADAIGAALSRADAVIITGGIGPTQDDVTREAISAVTGRALVRDPKIEENLRRRFAEFGRPMPEMNVRQADVPDGASIIEQSWGTAPGLIVPHGAGVIYAVPGVPAEMEDMLSRAVLPDLLRRAGQPSQIVSRVVRIAGVSESTIAEQLRDVWDVLGGETTMAFLAGGGEVRIRLTAKAPDPSRAQELVAAAETTVRASLGAAVVGVDGETLETVVGTLLLARGWSLGAAESLTGGALGSRITSAAGASEYFRGSIVSYATEVKEELLGVPASILDEHGPVSEPVARAMAQGARDRLKADVAVALTGVAGPTEQGRPVGTVVVAVAGPLGNVVREIRLPGDRNTVRTLAVSAGLNLVRLYLLEAI